MAIIESKPPSASNPEAIVRVVIKLTESKRATADTESAPAGSVLATLRRAAPGTEFEPYFHEEGLRAATLAPFNRYLFAAEVADRAAATALVRDLAVVARGGRRLRRRRTGPAARRIRPTIRAAATRGTRRRSLQLRRASGPGR